MISSNVDNPFNDPEAIELQMTIPPGTFDPDNASTANDDLEALRREQLERSQTVIADTDLVLAEAIRALRKSERAHSFTFYALGTCFLMLGATNIYQKVTNVQLSEKLSHAQTVNVAVSNIVSSSSGLDSATAGPTDEAKSVQLTTATFDFKDQDGTKIFAVDTAASLTRLTASPGTFVTSYKPTDTAEPTEIFVSWTPREQA